MNKPAIVLKTAFIFLVLIIWGCGRTGDKSAAYQKPVIDNSQSPYTKLRGIPMQDVRLTDGFWADRFHLAETKMVHTLEEAMLGECTANLNRIKEAAGLIDGPQHGSPWGDGDNYKWMESMAHIYNVTKDPALDQKMDEWIEIVGMAIDPDGYISTNIGHATAMRFQRVNAHEMYNMGHLLTAACIHFRSTGKENFLDLAKKNADFLYSQWKAEPVHMARFPWNPSVFMGMAEMYRTTHDPRYLELLQIMIDNRGSRPNPDRDHRYGGTDQTQDRVPLREDSIAVGHAVTGTYFYCGAADLYAETGDQELFDALERIWKDIHQRKIDIVCGAAYGGQGTTGGLSPRGDEVHESFANAPYLQPNLYNETCANIGTGMFNYRMLMLTGEAKYAEWTERMMYNTLNSGVDLQGEHWFYCNPISWDGSEGEFGKQTNGRDPERIVPKHHSGVRWEFMNCYCCPPSVTRTTAKVHNWFYNVSDDGALWINFYGGNTLSTTLTDGSTIALTQVTNYPWEGSVSITIDKAGKESFPIHLRIPGWTEDAVITVNGELASEEATPGSYLTLERDWSAGDRINLELPMPIRLMEARPELTNMKDKVAVMRGPVVYCMELPKQEGGEAIFENGVFIPQNIQLTAAYRPDYLGGLTVISGKALTQAEKEAYVNNVGRSVSEADEKEWKDNELYRPLTSANADLSEGAGSVELELIPYYAWANRGLAHMDVWLPLAR